MTGDKAMTNIADIEVVRLGGRGDGVQIKVTHARCHTKDGDDFHLALSGDHMVEVGSPEEALRIGLDGLIARREAVENVSPNVLYVLTTPRAKARREFLISFIEEQLRSDLSGVRFSIVPGVQDIGEAK